MQEGKPHFKASGLAVLKAVNIKQKGLSKCDEHNIFYEPAASVLCSEDEHQNVTLQQ